MSLMIGNCVSRGHQAGIEERKNIDDWCLSQVACYERVISNEAKFF